MVSKTKPLREWNKLDSFPKNQETPEITLFGGYVRDSDSSPETDIWSIMNDFGPKSYVGTIGKPQELGPDAKITLDERVKLREEEFGGVSYNGGVIHAMNRPAYAILKRLKEEVVSTSEIPSDFVKELTRYKLINCV